MGKNVRKIAHNVKTCFGVFSFFFGGGGGGIVVWGRRGGGGVLYSVKRIFDLFKLHKLVITCKIETFLILK